MYQAVAGIVEGLTDNETKGQNVGMGCGGRVWCGIRGNRSAALAWDPRGPTHRGRTCVTPAVARAIVNVPPNTGNGADNRRKRRAAAHAQTVRQT
jgi:hypothetical protein